MLNNSIKTNERGTTCSSNSFRKDTDYRENRFNNKLENIQVVRRGDVFYAELEGSKGCEQGGIRPVIIIQNDVGNKYSPTVIVAAITSQIHKAKLPTHVLTEDNNDSHLDKNSVILLEQIRTLDKRRLKEKIGHFNDEDMKKVNKALLISVGLADEVELKQEINKKEEYKRDEFSIERARFLSDKIDECQKRIDCNSNKSITTKLQQDKMSYIYELKMYCKTFNQDYRFYYNPNTNTNVNNERGIEGRRVVNA